MNKNRPRLIGLAAAIVAVIVVLVWWIGAGNHDEGDDEDQTTASAAVLSRAANGDVIVALTSGQQSRIGLKTAALAPVVHVRELTGYGEVVDPAPLAALDAQLIAARAALDASQAEYARAKLLHSEHQNISLKDYQAAQARLRADHAQLDLLDQRLAGDWGAPIAALAPAARARLIAAAIRRQLAILRVAVAPGQPVEQLPAQAEVTIVGGSRPIAVQAIWYAPSVDPELQGQSFLMRADASGFSLRPGMAVSARLSGPGAGERGVVVPSAAVVRSAGGVWAYVQIAPDKFERRPVAAGAATGGGWFESGGFAAGDRVVVTGAQALLSEEFKSQIQVQD
ncbi:MAG TPA: hypothetical protein VMV27_00755 [Candidatus Binataceae bacterium]|nr:hypothetical protein [Candidatus Binataceae bacterium]